MSAVATIVFLLLAAIAALYVAWGFSLRWPARDERSLVALVIGATGKTKRSLPPGWWRSRSTACCRCSRRDFW
jgi:hypothetical protein